VATVQLAEVLVDLAPRRRVPQILVVVGQRGVVRADLGRRRTRRVLAVEIRPGTGRRVPVLQPLDSQTNRVHGHLLLGLRYEERASAAAAQTERRAGVPGAATPGARSSEADQGVRRGRHLDPRAALAAVGLTQTTWTVGPTALLEVP